MIIEICSSKVKAPWIRLVSSNGQILMASETYQSISNARRAGKRLAEKLGLDWAEVHDAE